MLSSQYLANKETSLICHCQLIGRLQDFLCENVFGEHKKVNPYVKYQINENKL